MIATATEAELARSILSCPASVELVVDGHPHVGADSGLGLRDEGGVPTFWCRPGSLMDRAAAEGAGALVTFSSGLGPEGSPLREVTLTVAGHLVPAEAAASEACTCCGELRRDVSLALDFVVLTQGGSQRRVPLRDFADPALCLNRGYLQRSLEHANDCHRDDLAQVVTRTTGQPTDAVLDASLSDLTREGAELAWIDVDGAHRTSLWFSRPAATVEELAALLRHELHAGIC